MDRLSGKVALISGGARGMGASHARAMVAEGARVVICDLLDDDGRALAGELGPSATYVHMDVTKPADWDAAVETALSAYGRLDVLVNNAGIANRGPIEEYTHDQWDQIIAINLTGVFNGIKAAVPALLQNHGGSIINISSSAGMHAFPQMPGYTAAKFGVRGLTKEAALDLGKHGIRVNSVHPGGVHTQMYQMYNGGPEGTRHIALDRIGEPSEVSNLIVYLASDESSYSTGAEFLVDGGETAGMAANLPK